MNFEDFPVGFTFETGERTLSEEDILGFAQEWDPQNFHVDPDAAKASIYGGIIASGFHTLAAAFRLTLETNTWSQASMGSPGMDELRWKLPVRPGDTLKVTCEVIESRPSRSKPDRGIARILCRVHNQDGDEVMTYIGNHLLRRRGA